MADNFPTKKILPTKRHLNINIPDYFAIKLSTWFECKFCGRKITRRDDSEFCKHINENHKELHMQYDTLRHWTKHFIETAQTIYICNICKKEFDVTYNLREHALSHITQDFDETISFPNYSGNSEASCSSHAGAASSSRDTTSNSSMQATRDHRDNIWRYFKITAENVAQCNICKKCFKQNESIKTLAEHLWKMHKMEKIAKSTKKYYTRLNTYQCILCNLIIISLPQDAEITLLHHMETKHAYQACISAVSRRDNFSHETVLQSQTSQEQSEEQIEGHTEEHNEQQIEEHTKQQTEKQTERYAEEQTERYAEEHNKQQTKEQPSTSQITSASNREQPSTSQRTSASNRQQLSTLQRTSAFNQEEPLIFQIRFYGIPLLHIVGNNQSFTLISQMISAIMRQQRFTSQRIHASNQEQPFTLRRISVSNQAQPSTSQRTFASNQEQAFTLRRISASNQAQPSTLQRTFASNQEQPLTLQRRSASNPGQPSTSQGTSASGNRLTLNTPIIYWNNIDRLGFFIRSLAPLNTAINRLYIERQRLYSDYINQRNDNRSRASFERIDIEVKRILTDKLNEWNFITRGFPMQLKTETFLDCLKCFFLLNRSNQQTSIQMYTNFKAILQWWCEIGIIQPFEETFTDWDPYNELD